MWQTSDKVTADTITSVTKNCIRSDGSCELSARILSTTCAGTLDYYDVNGILRVEDNNLRTTEVECVVCGGRWLVEHSFGKIEVNSLKENGE